LVALPVLKTIAMAQAGRRHVKPMASRSDPAELFVLAIGFRG
jgi:hypothetical protein